MQKSSLIFDIIKFGPRECFVLVLFEPVDEIFVPDFLNRYQVKKLFFGKRLDCLQNGPKIVPFRHLLAYSDDNIFLKDFGIKSSIQCHLKVKIQLGLQVRNRLKTILLQILLDFLNLPLTLNRISLNLLLRQFHRILSILTPRK